uniref:C2 domain-containing protein n=1 Tax=Amphora coffeiformis TaxID=265554 RepID=A0A7S3L3W1_9STRA|mmetsp:Transcript_11508/g.21909  ORF Transcript_11508/g.21909 Transcript_11508/m.21909 type:complete len:134 (+) Transcript_11508:134-535(+)
MGVLTVVLERIDHLRDKDALGGGASDPYVKFELEQDNLVLDKDFGKKQSSIKKDDCSPVYNETFTWEIPTLKNMKLWVKVMDEDRGMDDTLGKACLDLEKFKPTSAFKSTDLLLDKNMVKRDAVMFLKVKYVS